MDTQEHDRNFKNFTPTEKKLIIEHLSLSILHFFRHFECHVIL
jgi:hypothetical protein